MAAVSDGGGDALALNIMPLLDIFSILILFLLMSFSNDPLTHDVRQGLELPDSKTLTSLDEVPAIVVTKSEILVNDKKVTTILNGDVQERDRSQGAIFPLFTELQKVAEITEKASRKKTSKNIPITLEMDKGHSFKLLKRIMLSGQQAKFVTFKLMVSKTAK